MSIWCALVYLVTMVPALPMATAFLEWLEGDHSVRVHCEGDSFRVVLSHDTADPRTAPTHTHRALSHGILLWAHQFDPGTSDHVLLFRNSQLSCNRESREPLVGPTRTVLASQLAGVAFKLPEPPRQFTRLLSHATLLPTLPVSVVESTVFLI
jgi:hypothetical protein